MNQKRCLLLFERRSETAAFEICVLLLASLSGLVIVLAPGILRYILFALGIILFTTKPDLCMYFIGFLLFAIPFSDLKINLPFDTPYVQVLILLLFVIVAFRSIVRKSLFHTHLNSYILLLFLIGLISTFTGVFRGQSLITGLYIFQRSIVQGILLFFILTQLIRSERAVNRLIAFVIGGIVLTAIIALMQYQFGEGLIHSILIGIGYTQESTITTFDPVSGIFRVSSTFMNPNMLGGVMATVVPLSLAKLSNSNNISSRLLMIGSVVLEIIGVLLALSRGAFVGLMVGLLVYTLIQSNKKWKLVSFVTICVLSAVVIIFTPLGLRGLSGLQFRIEDYSQAFSNILNHPFLGTGFFDGDPLMLGTSLGYRVHDLYLEMALKIGFLGLGTFVVIVGVIIRDTIRWMSRDINGHNRNLRVGLLASLCVILFAGIFDHYSFSAPNMNEILWLVLGLLAILNSEIFYSKGNRKEACSSTDE